MLYVIIFQGSSTNINGLIQLSIALPWRILDVKQATTIATKWHNYFFKMLLNRQGNNLIKTV